MRNPKFFNKETKKQVYVMFNDGSFMPKWQHKQLIEFACENFSKLIVKYGTIINDDINKNSNLYSHIRQGFNLYSLNSKLIDSEIYNEISTTINSSYERLEVSYTMRLFSYLRENNLNSSFVLLM